MSLTIRPARALLVALVVLLSACSPNSTATPKAPASPTQQNEGLNCASGDVPINVAPLGWGFCHPSGWSIVQRNIRTASPDGVDTTLDVVASDGFFGFIIVGSYERGGAASLQQWLGANEPGDTATQPIAWGNAREAVEVSGQLKRYALTDHRVYALTLREGAGNLDLEAAIKPRLSTWSFII